MNSKKYKAFPNGNKELSASIQRAWFAMGFEWMNSGKKIKHTNQPYLYIKNGFIVHGESPDNYNKSDCEEFKLSDYYKVGDRVRLVSERPENWASKGGMDHYLGAEVTIRIIMGDLTMYIEGSSYQFKLSDIECKIPQTVIDTIPEKSFTTTPDGTSSSIPTEGSYKGDDALDVYLSFFKPAGYSNRYQDILEENILDYSQFSWGDSGEAYSSIESKKQYTRSEIEQWFKKDNSKFPTKEIKQRLEDIYSEYTIPINKWEDVKVGDLVEVVGEGNNDTCHEKYKKPVRIGDKFIVNTIEDCATKSGKRVITSKCGFVLYGHGRYFDYMKITRKVEVGVLNERPDCIQKFTLSHKDSMISARCGDQDVIINRLLTPSECFIPTPTDPNKVHLPKTVIRKVENNPPKICTTQKVILPLPKIKPERISAPTISDIKISL